MTWWVSESSTAMGSIFGYKQIDVRPIQILLCSLRFTKKESFFTFIKLEHLLPDPHSPSLPYHRLSGQPDTEKRRSTQMEVEHIAAEEHLDTQRTDATVLAFVVEYTPSSIPPKMSGW